MLESRINSATLNAYLLSFENGAVKIVRADLTQHLQLRLSSTQITPIDSPRSQEAGEVKENLRVIASARSSVHGANVDGEPPDELARFKLMYLKHMLHVADVAHQQLVVIDTIYRMNYISLRFRDHVRPDSWVLDVDSGYFISRCVSVGEERKDRPIVGDIGELSFEGVDEFLKR